MTSQSAGLLFFDNSCFFFSVAHCTIWRNHYFPLLVFVTLGFLLSVFFCTSSNITSSYNFNTFYTLLLIFRHCFAFCPTILPCSINLSLSISSTWSLSSLMLSFSLKKLFYSLTIKVNSSWLISSSISVLDIIFSMLFNLLQANKANFVCFSFFPLFSETFEQSNYW